MLEVLVKLLPVFILRLNHQFKWLFNLHLNTFYIHKIGEGNFGAPKNLK